MNGLVTTNVSNVKISKVESKMPNTSGLVNTTVLSKKLVKLRVKYAVMIKILLFQNLSS